MFKKVFCTCLILVLPISYYNIENDSTNVWFRLGGGTGQYSSVIRSCDTPPLAHSDDYADFGAELAYRPDRKAPFYLGLRGGHLKAGILNHPVYGNSLQNGYMNPFVSVETHYFGLGAGWIRNLGPVTYNRLGWFIDGNFIDFDPDLDFRNSKNYSSGHLRLGSVSSVYFLASYNEGVPIVSQYGYLLLGVGYGRVPRWHFVSGLSAGFYDEVGAYFGIAHDLGKSGVPQLSFRLGSSENEFEGGISLNWTIPIN
jgi:hypothetical protein